MKLKVDYIDLKDESKHSCLVNNESIKTREDIARVKGKIERATKREEIVITNWKRMGVKR